MNTSQLSNRLADKQKQKKKIITCVIFIVVFSLVVAFMCLENRCPRKQFLCTVFVSEAKITDKSIDEDSTPSQKYVKVSLVNPPVSGVSIKDDDSWISVTDDYYAKHNAGDAIGVLVGNYDIYKEKMFGLIQNGGQTFEKNIWGIEDIFDSVSSANEAYPKKSFTDNAQLTSKANTDNRYYFVLTYEDREMTVEVDGEQYGKYNENDSVKCSFEGYGEYVKISEVL